MSWHGSMCAAVDCPLQMKCVSAGDLMTVNLNLAGLPAVCLPCGFVQQRGGRSLLPVGMQLLGRAFGEADLLQIAHVYEQTAGCMSGIQPMVWAE